MLVRKNKLFPQKNCIYSGFVERLNFRTCQSQIVRVYRTPTSKCRSVIFFFIYSDEPFDILQAFSTECVANWCAGAKLVSSSDRENGGAGQRSERWGTRISLLVRSHRIQERIQRAKPRSKRCSGNIQRTRGENREAGRLRIRQQDGQKRRWNKIDWHGRVRNFEKRSGAQWLWGGHDGTPMQTGRIKAYW